MSDQQPNTADDYIYEKITEERIQHIDRSKAFDVDNGEGLCYKCHKEADRRVRS